MKENLHTCPQDESGLCDNCPCHEQNKGWNYMEFVGKKMKEVYEIGFEGGKEQSRQEIIKMAGSLDRIGIGGDFGEGYEKGYDKCKSDLIEKIKGLEKLR